MTLLVLGSCAFVPWGLAIGAVAWKARRPRLTEIRVVRRGAPPLP